jgi:hypothetical protein
MYMYMYVYTVVILFGTCITATYHAVRLSMRMIPQLGSYTMGRYNEGGGELLMVKYHR